MGTQAKYENLHLLIAIAKRIAESPSASHEIKSPFEIAAKLFDQLSCTRAMESLKTLPEQVCDHIRATAMRDVAEENRFNSFLEKTVSASPEVPPNATS